MARLPWTSRTTSTKGMIAPGDADAGSDSSGIRDAGRLIYTLTPMSEDEAKRFDIEPDERHSYVRLDSAKVNIARPSEGATWFHLVGEPIGNGTEDYPSGDEIQVAKPWQPRKRGPISTTRCSTKF
jgi:hypothetical protein